MKGPLAGIRVLDLSQVIAGPYGPVLLAHSGAEVIKVEPLQGELGRSLSALFQNMNRGKRGIALNLQLDEGRRVFYRLVETADVLVENFRPGVVERLGVDFATLSRLNPRLIYVSVTAFGSSGPYAHRPGFDPLLQAMAGTERAQGGAHNPPVFLRIPITDYVSGLMAASAVTLALFERERTGRGQHLQLSLLRAGIFINAEAFTRYPGRPPRRLPDAGQHGFGPLDRMYETADGWIFLLVPDGDEDCWRRLCHTPGFERLDDPRFADPAGRGQHTEELAVLLEEAFRAASVEAWLERLQQAGVPCAPVITGYDRRFFEDIQPIINRYFVRSDHPELGQVESVGNLIDFRATPAGQETLPAPLLGQHGDAILQELGYSPAEIAGLRRAGAVG